MDPISASTCVDSEPHTVGTNFSAVGNPHATAIENGRSHIHTLPLEILGLIFEIAHQTSQSVEDGKAKEFPVVLSQVTQRWREVALNLPVLWTSIRVSMPLILDAVRTHIERSQSLSIDLRLTLLKEEPKKEEFEDLRKLFVSVIPRCRSIDIFRSVSHDAEVLTRLLASFVGLAAPLLKSLSLSWCDAGPDWTPDTVHDLPIFAGAMPLTDLRLGGVALLFKLPLSHLTTLHLVRHGHDIPYSHFRRMVASCSSLIALNIYDDLIVWPEMLPSAFNIDTLRSLRMYGSMLGVSKLLNCMSAPNLEELVIDPFELSDLEGFPVHRIPKFPYLKLLHLGTPRSSDFDFTSVAEAFPAVECLILKHFCAPETIPGHTVLWPGLQILALRRLTVDDERVLAELLTYRKDAGYPLRKVCLDRDTIDRVVWLPRQLEVEELDVQALHEQSMPA